MTYTISVKERNGSQVIPLKKFEATEDEAMHATWAFSFAAALCDVVVTCGKKHVATYRCGHMTQYKGKEHKP